MKLRKANNSGRKIRLALALLVTALFQSALSSVAVSSPVTGTHLVTASGFERPWFRKEPGNPASAATNCQGPTFPCIVNLSISDVEYLGKSAGGANDKFKVKILFSPQSACFERFPSPQGFGQLTTLFQATFAVTLKITRHLGHTDSGFKTFTDSSTGVISVDVNVPRALLETDPVTVEANVDMTATLNSRTIAKISGSGVPSLAPGQQTFAGNANSAQCFPTVTITSVNYAPGSAAQKDVVTVNWTVAEAQSSCLRISNVVATAKVTRADGSQGTAQGGANGTAALQISGSPGNVVSFELNVTALAASSAAITANAKLNKNL
jgi:hypothetical protein